MRNLSGLRLLIAALVIASAAAVITFLVGTGEEIIYILAICATIGVIIGVIFGTIAIVSRHWRVNYFIGTTIGVIIGDIFGMKILGVGYSSPFVLSINFVILPTFSFIAYIITKYFKVRAEEKAQKHQQSLQTVPGLFDTAKSLSSQAVQLFQQKNYLYALQTYENALNNFTHAHEGAKTLNDTELANSISNNISALQKNITTCKNALGADIASKAKSKFETGDFIGAIQTYEEALKYFQEPELISKTKVNVDNCYMEIDARNVEELSSEAISLLKEAAALNETFKAIEKLNQADKKLNEAVSLATKRKLTNSLSQLNAISKDIRTQRDIVHERLSNESVISEKYDLDSITPRTAPSIPVYPLGSAIMELEITRGYEVLENKDMRFGILVTNRSNYTVNDVDVHLKYDRSLFSLKGKEVISLGNITKNNPKTATYFLTPLVGCVHNSKISAIVSYKDASDNSLTVQMRPKEVHCISPFLAEKPMTEEQFSKLYESHSCYVEGIVFKGISPDAVTNFIVDSAKNKRYVVKNSLVNGSHIIYLSSVAKDKTFYLNTVIIRGENSLTHVGLRACSNNEGGINNFIIEILTSLRHYVNTVQSAREVENVTNNISVQIINSEVHGGVSIGGDAFGRDESFNQGLRR